MASPRTIRIGCASGFWGDTSAASAQLVRRGDIDFLVYDFLAEITLSLLARIRARKPDAGFVPDFVDTLGALLPELKQRGVRVVSNGGGMNPEGAAAALARKAAEAGLDLRIAFVTGDDLMPRAGELRSSGVREMFSGEPLPDALVSANAYLGAWPIAVALDRGADIVITGRCVDSAVTLGPLIHAFGWSRDDYDRLAQGSLAGHLLECGAQVTGGLFTDWADVPGWEDMGFPVAECAPDGGFVVTKPGNTGGLITPLTVAEQLLYEIGDPAAYALPDVICDFRHVRLEQEGRDRVRVTGARGRAPSGKLKVSATWHDGFRMIGSVTIGGRDAAPKAERVGRAIIARAERLMAEAQLPPFAETSVEVLGSEAIYGPLARPELKAAREVVLKIAARHESEAALKILAREIAPAGTAMAQGLTGFFGGRPSPQPVLRTFSFLWDATDVAPAVMLDETCIEVPFKPPLNTPETRETSVFAEDETSPLQGDAVRVPLIALAVGRSGDKGNMANIGVAARRPEFLPLIRAALTADAVKAYFAHTGVTRVERFDLPGISALNFLLHDALGGGGVASLRIDPQGKAFAQMLLDIDIPAPRALAERLERERPARLARAS